MIIKVLDLNFWLIPFPISIHKKKRISAFASLVKKINPDIITLQEVWMNSYLEKIKELLPEYLIYNSKSLFLNESGLVTLTKIKPVSWKWDFFNRAPFEAYNIIELPKKYGSLKIVNTHLHPPLKDECTNKNSSQFNRIKKECERKKNVLLSGDLNLNEQNFSMLNNNFFEFKKNQEFTFEKKNFYKNWMFNRIYNMEGCYDWIALKNGGNKKISIIKTEVIKKPLLSDHYALLSRISIR